jgi:UDP-glucose 4-epimerase
MKIVVTGGAGFIGANLCRALEERPEVHEVVVLDNLSTGYAENLRGTKAKLIEGSILDRKLLGRVLTDAHAVVHLAARPSVPRSVADPVASHEVNATGTMYVLEASRAAGVPIIAASSSSVYGPSNELPKHEEMATRPQSPYAASKLATESYVLAHHVTYRMPVLVFRFFNVYGPLQSSGHAYAAAIPAFIDAALSGTPMHVHGDGKQSRDFTYVGSVAAILADAAVRQVSNGRPVNLAFGTRTNLLEVINKINSFVGKESAVVFQPARAGDVRDSQAANDCLAKLFPSHRPTPLDDGLRQTIEWFQRTNSIVAPRLAPPEASLRMA